MTIAEAAEAFLEAKPKTGLATQQEAVRSKKGRRTWDRNTVRQFRSTVRLVTKAIPGPVAAVTHDDLLRLNGLFDRLPRMHHKTPRHKSMTLEEIGDEAAQALSAGVLSQEETDLSIGTTNRHYDFLTQLFDWIVRSIYLRGHFTIVVSGFPFSRT